MSAARWPIMALSGVAGTLLFAPLMLRPAPRLLFNTTASAPIGLYRVDPAPARKGDLVVVRPHPALARWLAKRGYLPANVPLLKRLAAVEGQSVCGREGRITIDGHPVAVARRHDRIGRPLRPFESCRVLGDGEVFLLNTDAPDSLDSRYFGPLDASHVIGRATPFWTKTGR